MYQDSINYIPIRQTNRMSMLDNTDGLGLNYDSSHRSHAADAIKTMEDAHKISNWLVEGRKYKQNLLFTAGCNFGLRCSDLRMLRFGNFVDENWDFYGGIRIVERKTAKGRMRENMTRTTKKAPRVVIINDAVMDAFCLYLGGLKHKVDRNDFVFPGKTTDKPISYSGVYHYFMKLLDENSSAPNGKPLRESLSRPIHASTHFMRKTFAYHFILESQSGLNRNRKIEMLQKCFGHSNQMITLSYAGITDDEIASVVHGLNVGSGHFLNVRAMSVEDAANANILTGAVLNVEDDD